MRSLESGLPLYMAEREILGTDHAEVGYWLAERWNLPPLLVQAIRFHHSPDDCTDLRSMPLVQLIHNANDVSKALQEPEGTTADDTPAAAEPPHIEAARRELLDKKPLIINLCYTVLP